VGNCIFWASMPIVASHRCFRKMKSCGVNACREPCIGTTLKDVARKVGFSDPRLVEDAPINVENADVEQFISESGKNALEFYSATYRLWKLDLEPYYCSKLLNKTKRLDPHQVAVKPYLQSCL
jgi:hypothetical protein